MEIRHLLDGVTTEYVTYPGAEQYNAYIQSTVPATEAAVLPTLITFGDTVASRATATTADDQTVIHLSTSEGDYFISIQLAGGHEIGVKFWS